MSAAPKRKGKDSCKLELQEDYPDHSQARDGELDPAVSSDAAALVGAAYAACAKYVSEWNDGLNETQCIMRGSLGWKEQKRGIFSVEEGILSLTPEDAARALAEHDNALVEKCAKVCDDYEEIKRIKGQHDREGAAHNIAIAIRALSKPAPAVEPEKR